MVHVQVADSEAALRRCFPVMFQLRPHLDESSFLKQVQVQSREGFRIAYIATRGRVAAVAGYRIQHMLHQGKTLYVDDLITDERSRSSGLGGAVLDWLAQQARRQDCDSLELDSGVQRVGAHRFYLRKGMHITSYHFRLPLKTESPRVLQFGAKGPPNLGANAQVTKAASRGRPGTRRPRAAL